jgi:UDP-N-acetylglucosamine enolpyruvyl transferase
MAERNILDFLRRAENFVDVSITCTVIVCLAATSAEEKAILQQALRKPEFFFLSVSLDY